MSPKKKIAAIVTGTGIVGASLLVTLIPNIIYDSTTPDNKYRVQVCDCDRHQIYEIRARLEPDGAWHHIGPQVPALEDVRNDLIVTNERVVWVQGETASGSRFAVRSARVNATGSTIVLSHQNPQNGQGFDLPIQKISEDRVRFRSDPFVDESFAVYVTPIVGGAIQQEVFSDGFESGGVTRWN